jgi:hypothetical protein
MGSVTVQDTIKVFGGHLKKDFPFASGWINLNHGKLSPRIDYPSFTI